MNIANKLGIILIVILLSSVFIFAHPGKTDSNGCHTCRTNCEKYGIEYGFYHRHNPTRACDEEPLASSESVPEPKPTEIIKPPLKQSPKINDSKGAEIKPDITLPSSPKVISIIDGDTIKVRINGKTENVRLLGIDSPEVNKKQCFSKEATLKLRELIKDKIVRLEQDSQQPDRDKFRRLLRYVYLENGTLINEEMIKQGYAIAYTKYNSDKIKEFIELEKIAKRERRGLWSSCNIFSRLLLYLSANND